MSLPQEVFRIALQFPVPHHPIAMSMSEQHAE